MRSSAKRLMKNSSHLVLGAALGLVVFAVPSDKTYAAPLSPTSGTNTVTGTDSIDASSEAGATDANISYDLINAGAVSTLILSITGAGTVNLGGISVTNGDNVADRTRLNIGNGLANTIVIFNDAVNGDETGGTATTGDLDIFLYAVNAASGNTTVQFLSNVDLGQNGSLSTFSDANGTSTVVINATLSASTASIGTASAITLGPGLTNGSTAILTTGVVTTGAGITINPDSSFTNGTITIINSSGSTLNLANFSLSATGAALTDYQLSLADAAADLILTATAISTGPVAGVAPGAAEAFAQGKVATAGDATVAAAYTAASVAGGASEILAAEQSQNQPDVLTATNAISAAIGTQVFSISSQRLGARRQTEGYGSSGVQLAMADDLMMSDGSPALIDGDVMKNKGVWLRPFGSYGDQDTVNNIDGYTALTYGLAAGIDTMIGRQSSLGLAFSYAHSNIDGNGAGGADTGVDSYQMTIYGDYSGSLGYFEGMLAYAYNDIGSTRHLTFGGLNEAANANYHSNQYMARLGAGIPIDLDGSTVLTPQGSLQYTYIDTSGYTETGAGVSNLNVQQQSSEILLGMAGAKLEGSIRGANGTFSPQVHANLMYDFIGDLASSTSIFTGGGTAFEIQGSEVDQFGVNLGAGMSYTFDNIDISAVYDAELRDSFTGHSGRLEFRLNF